ncbi:MAG: PepSY domain-containing protein [Rhizorhabdus sp.]|uniref:PepSY-associated TM helix domain-containing protein n=1 Tax=Rhizorhabdus sp. TaxID=1968843 RepID=UPI001B4F30A1|nr:PepSY-associated TM helix domain-containing protein [Rhizorhabdus sp.]MBP8231311.1 PepSY domain-containing protein [Rhizorhabdus sp.]
MRLLDQLHRWAGGVLGILLLVLGLSGAALVHRDAWIGLPHVSDQRLVDPAALGDLTTRLMADPATRPQSIIFASDTLGLVRLSGKGGAGAYADQSGAIVARWSSQWERPELWLFDLHHHLLAGDVGEAIIGVAGAVGLFFVISGVTLWWRTRKSFAFRLWPARITRPAILRHHRDLGVLVAPLLLLSFYTGTALVFRPFAALTLGPGAPAAIEAALKPPRASGARLSDAIDWRAIVATAHKRFPEAELRLVSLPRKDSGLISVRMRQPEEWLPNGRTTLWFAADSGRLVAARDARDLGWQARAFNLFYPLHAAKVGGLAWRLVMTISGLALALLGGFTCWSFWFARRRTQIRRA